MVFKAFGIHSFRSQDGQKSRVSYDRADFIGSDHEARSRCECLCCVLYVVSLRSELKKSHCRFRCALLPGTG